VALFQQRSSPAHRLSLAAASADKLVAAWLDGFPHKY